MWDFKINDSLTIKVYTGSLFDPKLNCDASGISVDPARGYEQQVGLIPQVINNFGNTIKKSYEKNAKSEFGKKMPPSTECMVIKTEKTSPKYLFNIFIPTLPSFIDLQTFDMTIQKCIENLFKKANQIKDVKSLALPLLASGLNGAPNSWCVNALVNHILDLEKKGLIKHINEIHLVDIDKQKTDLIASKIKSLIKQNDQLGKSSLVEQNDDDINGALAKISVDFASWETCDCCRQRLENVSKIQCGHMFCLGCLIEVKEKKKCLLSDCPKLEKKSEQKIEKTQKESKIEEKEDTKKSCEICTETFDELIKLDKCGHELCSDCKEKMFANKPQCPFCLIYYGTPIGLQPRDGTMKSHFSKSSLPGYAGSETIVIEYYIPSGIQTKDHPSPGKHYSGISRTAYLPKTKDGLRALELLKKAFDNRLIFTIGTSRTTGYEGLTWNDIHHKTNYNGEFGYPDSNYLSRLFDELKAHGIE